MRQVTEQIASAFINGERKTVSNTHTDGKNLFLHGNLIAKKENGSLYITDAGWQTNTTKERLNGLPGVSICQKKGTWYLNGTKWNGQFIKVN